MSHIDTTHDPENEYPEDGVTSYPKQRDWLGAFIFGFCIVFAIYLIFKMI